MINHALNHATSGTGNGDWSTSESQTTPQTASQLAEHAAGLQSLFDHMPAHVTYWDRNMRNVLANAAFTKSFDLSAENIKGRHARDLLGETIFSQNAPFMRRALAGEANEFQRTFVDAAGAIRHAQVSFIPDIIDEQVVGCYVHVADVTPVVESRQAMAQAQQLANLGSWVIDLRTRAISWSDEMYRIVGADRETFEPDEESYLALIADENRKSLKSKQQKMLHDGDEYELEYTIRRLDGTVCDH